MATLEDAILLAVISHQGQKEKNGTPYILHPIRVMGRVHTEAEKMVAILHDVVEDTGVTLEDLRKKGFSPEVIAGVDAVSRRPDESYDEFIERLKPNPIARRVKIADIEDNMDIRRLDVLSERDLERSRRYREAWESLTTLEKTEGDDTAWRI